MNKVIEWLRRRVHSHQTARSSPTDPHTHVALSSGLEEMLARHV